MTICYSTAHGLRMTSSDSLHVREINRKAFALIIPPQIIRPDRGWRFARSALCTAQWRTRRR